MEDIAVQIGPVDNVLQEAEEYIIRYAINLLMIESEFHPVPQLLLSALTSVTVNFQFINYAKNITFPAPWLRILHRVRVHSTATCYV